MFDRSIPLVYTLVMKNLGTQSKLWEASERWNSSFQKCEELLDELKNTLKSPTSSQKK